MNKNSRSARSLTGARTSVRSNSRTPSASDFSPSRAKGGRCRGLKSALRCGRSAFLLLTLLACIFATACKPGLIQQAEKLAGQIKAEPGTPEKLRSWFNEIQTTTASDPQKPKQLPVPDSLGSTWAKGTTAYPLWSDDGALQTITMTRDGFEFITIGPPRAKPTDLHPAQNKGEPPTNYGQIADGIYAWVPNK